MCDVTFDNNNRLALLLLPTEFFEGKFAIKRHLRLQLSKYNYFKSSKRSLGLLSKTKSKAKIRMTKISTNL